jgi:acetyl-CoA acetyltransferase
MSGWLLRDLAAIAGIGSTEFSKNSGVSTSTLAARAIAAAVADAGLEVKDIDGLVSYSVGDSVEPRRLAPMLGLSDLRFWNHQDSGGVVSHSAVGLAAMACATGLADHVVCYRALNARSGYRMGGAGRSPVDRNAEMSYMAPYGWFTPPQEFAMAARQHMIRFGTTDEHLGQVAVQQRQNAMMNPKAMMRSPMSLDDYMASPWIVEPFRLFDCCLETDGACAVVVTSSERARDLRQPPVLISGAGWGPGYSLTSNDWPDQTVSGAALMAPRLYSAAGIGPADIDVAMLYDCFTYTVVVQLEDYGFCAKGEGGPFIATGATTREGQLPVNTHGGFLSEAYIHGMNHITEAVTQLRGDAGDRQVPGAEVALSTGQPGVISGMTSALVLRAA